MADESAYPATSERTGLEDHAHGKDTHDGARASGQDTDISAGLSQPGFFAPLRGANFRWLIAGQTVSRLGDQFFLVAIPWLVLRITPAPLALSLVLGASSITIGLFTLVGGVLSDRYGPRGVMLVSDVARLALTTALAVLALLGNPPLWGLVGISALLGVAGGLFYPASTAMVPHLVASDELQAANSFSQLTLQSSNFVGPSLAGVLLGATRLAFGFVIDAASFAVSVLSLLAIRVPRRGVDARETSAPEAAEKKAIGGLAAMGEAWRFLRASSFLSTLLAISLILNFAVVGLFEVALPLLLKHWVGVANGPRAQGIAVGGFGLGSILGPVLAGTASKLRRKSLVATLCLVPTAGLIAAMPYVGGVMPLAALFGAVGLAVSVCNVLIITVIQRFIPLDMMGRLMSLILLGSFVASPLSIFAYGLAASVIPTVTWLFLAGAALVGIGAVLAITNKAVRQEV